MRRLATVFFAFAAGVFASQYLLPTGWLLLYAAVGCAVLGALWSLALHGDRRRRVALVALGLALAFAYDWAYVRLVQTPFEAMVGTTDNMVMEVADYPSAADYGSRIEVRFLDRGLRGRPSTTATLHFWT